MEKLELWINQLKKEYLTHFPGRNNMILNKNTRFRKHIQYKIKLKETSEENFVEISFYDKDLEIICSLFNIDPIRLPQDLQIELIYRECNSE